MLEIAAIVLLLVALFVSNYAHGVAKEALAAAVAEAELWERRFDDRDTDADEARAEVKRLTDIIIQFKTDGYAAPPWAGQQDEVWGSYAMTDEEELAEQERREREAAREADDELRKELEGL